MCLVTCAMWLTLPNSSFGQLDNWQLLYTLCIMYPIFGAVNGFFSSKLYTLFNSTNYLLLRILQIFAFPVFISCALVIMNTLEFIEGGYKVTMSVM